MGRDSRYGAFAVIILIVLALFYLKNPERLPGPFDSKPPEPGSNDPAGPRGPVSLDHIPDPKPLDLNTATFEDLLALPGVGEKTAERILRKRRELGGFASIDELTGIRWVDKVKVDRLKGLVTVGGEPDGGDG